jgi:hypothetical protein
MAVDDIIFDCSLIVIACNLCADISIILELISRVSNLSGVAQICDELNLKIRMDQTAFRAVANYLRDETKLYALFNSLDGNTPKLEFVKALLDIFATEELPKAFLRLSLYDNCLDAAEIRPEIYMYAFKRGVEFMWSETEVVPEAFHCEAIEFFKQFPEKDLLQYIPKTMKPESDTTIFGSSFFYACCSLPNGFPILEDHFSRKTDFSTIKFLIEFPKVEEQSLREIVTNDPEEISEVLFYAITTPSLYGKLDPVFDTLRSNSKDLYLASFWDILISRCFSEHLPVERIIPLPFFSKLHLSNILNGGRLRCVLRSRYYSEKLEIAEDWIDMSDFTI